MTREIQDTVPEPAIHEEKKKKKHVVVFKMGKNNRKYRKATLATRDPPEYAR